MAEGNVATCPQVFVVDTRSNYVSMPKETLRARLGQKLLLLLVGLTTLGLVVQGYFIYTLYKKTEVRPLSPCDCASVHLSDERESAWKFLFSRISLSLYVITTLSYG